MGRDDEPLFNKGFLKDVFPQQEAKALGEIDGLNQKAVTKTSVDDLCARFHEQFRVNALLLDEEGIHVDEQEAQIDVSRDPMRFIMDTSRPFYVPASAVTFIVPFSGDSELFRLSPSTYSLSTPYGKVVGQELHLTYTAQTHDPQKLRAEFDRDLAQIKTYVERLRAEAEAFNAQLMGKLRQRIETRRQKLLSDRSLVASLGFPIKRRDDVPQTYAAADLRKRAPSPMPPRTSSAAASTASSVPEPTITMDAYEGILKTISDMAVVLERSPSAFRTMGEEELRWQFLVALNGLYEGRATGETFNAGGKTDILIREGNANMFVAECKFWGGEKLFLETVDQLLGYLTWRDTKAAILVFNKNKDFSAVLATIRAALPRHPRFVRNLPYTSETGFRVAFSLPRDANREIIVTVLAFDVPS